MRHDIGSRVRVVTRNGSILHGTLVAAWQLHAGGWAISLQCDEGLRHVTTLERLVSVDDAPATDDLSYAAGDTAGNGGRAPRADAAATG